MIELSEYRREILLALHELGGAGSRMEVLKIIRERLRGRLNTYHWNTIGIQTGRPRWQGNVDYARRQLVVSGLVSANSPRGQWILSIYGKSEVEKLLLEGSLSDNQEQEEGEASRNLPFDSRHIR